MSRFLPATERKPNEWCWFAARAETEDTPTFLAVVETVLAMGIAVAVGICLNRWTYLLLASTFAPLLLLRSERSTQMGIRWFTLIALWGSKLPKRPKQVSTQDPLGEWIKYVVLSSIFLALYSLYYITIPIGAVIVKCCVTAYCVICHPLESIEAIPKNWQRVCLATDVTKPIELLPGIRWNPYAPEFGVQLRNDQQRQQGSVEANKEKQSPIQWVTVKIPGLPSGCSTCLLSLLLTLAVWCVRILIGVILGLIIMPFEESRFIFTLVIAFCVVASYVPAFWYRWSLKSTAIIWLPLLYIAADIVPMGWPIGRRLETICGSATAKTSRAYAVLVLVVLSAKFAGQIVWYKSIRSFQQEHEWLLSIAPLLRPIDIPVWQVLSLVNAVGAWALYLFADWQIRKQKYGEGLSDKMLNNSLSAAILVRWGIALYTSVCTLYAIYVIVKNSHPPEWHFRFFPWE